MIIELRSIEYWLHVTCIKTKNSSTENSTTILFCLEIGAIFF